MGYSGKNNGNFVEKTPNDYTRSIKAFDNPRNKLYSLKTIHLPLNKLCKTLLYRLTVVCGIKKTLLFYL